MTTLKTLLRGTILAAALGVTLPLLYPGQAEARPACWHDGDCAYCWSAGDGYACLVQVCGGGAGGGSSESTICHAI